MQTVMKWSMFLTSVVPFFRSCTILDLPEVGMKPVRSVFVPPNQRWWTLVHAIILFAIHGALADDQPDQRTSHSLLGTWIQ